MILKLLLLVVLHIVVAIPKEHHETWGDVGTQQNVEDWNYRSYFMKPRTFTNKIVSWFESIFRAILDYSPHPERRKDEPNQVEKFATNMLNILGVSRKNNPLFEACKEMGGILINGNCQAYFGDTRRTFEDARAFCQYKGGDLWTPDLRDPFLYQKLMKYMPHITSAVDKNVWIGYQQINGKTLSITGKDFSDAFLVQIFNGKPQNHNCFVLDYPNGQFKAMDAHCEHTKEFVCEIFLGNSWLENSINENKIP